MDLKSSIELLKDNEKSSIFGEENLLACYTVLENWSKISQEDKNAILNNETFDNKAILYVSAIARKVQLNEIVLRNIDKMSTDDPNYLAQATNFEILDELEKIINKECLSGRLFQEGTHFVTDKLKGAFNSPKEVEGYRIVNNRFDEADYVNTIPVFVKIGKDRYDSFKTTFGEIITPELSPSEEELDSTKER